MKPHEAAQQAAALASVLEHPGYKIVDEEMRKRIERCRDALSNPAKTADIRAVAELQGEIKALNNIRNFVKGTIKNAPREVSEDA